MRGLALLQVRLWISLLQNRILSVRCGVRPYNSFSANSPHFRAVDAPNVGLGVVISVMQDLVKPEALDAWC